MHIGTSFKKSWLAGFEGQAQNAQPTPDIVCQRFLLEYIDKMSPNQVYAYVLDRLNYYYSRLDQLTTEEYISFMNLLKEELNNPMYPNEIHNQIEEINKKVR